jgi:hypothetical protein
VKKNIDRYDAGMIVRPSWEMKKTSQPFLKSEIVGLIVNSEVVKKPRVTIKRTNQIKKPSVTLLTGDIRAAKIEAQKALIQAQIEKLSAGLS